MTHRSDLVPSDAIAITPSDTTQLGLVGLYVGGTGDVAVKGSSGVAVTFKACPVGFVITMQIAAVMATNTTATNLVGYKP